MKKYVFFLLSFIVCSNFSHAQIRLSSIKVDDWIKTNFSGQGVVIGNITHKGYPLAILSFTSTENVLKVPKGILLSTGNSFNVAGNNHSHNQSSTFSDISEPQTDPDLSKYVKEKLYDVCSIEFDFVPMDNTIQFNYQFGSDEYPEYVGSPYNDIFTFIVSDGTTSENIALVPETDLPVSINTINFKDNPEYFIDNNPFKQVIIKRQQPLNVNTGRTFPGRVWQGIKSIFSESSGGGAARIVIQPDPELVKTLDVNLYRNLRYDGITTKLVARAFVVPYKKYRLKIVIGDVADNIYDSGVFIEDKSLTSRKDVTQPGFVDYPDLRDVIDPVQILQGKTLDEILPAEYKKQANVPVRSPSVATQPAPVQNTAPAVTKAVPKFENAVIYFAFDQHDISAEEMAKLRDVLNRFSAFKDEYRLRVSGHTDNKGSMAYNMALSERRNDAVKAAVQEILGEHLQIPSVSRAYTQPVADNNTDSGRQANRRVELIFERKR